MEDAVVNAGGFPGVVAHQPLRRLRRDIDFYGGGAECRRSGKASKKREQTESHKWTMVVDYGTNEVCGRSISRSSRQPVWRCLQMSERLACRCGSPALESRLLTLFHQRLHPWNRGSAACGALVRSQGHRRTGRSFQGLESRSQTASMKLLLDTYIWIWSVLYPNKLGRTARRALGNPKNELHLSPVSIWEAHHLVLRGRLRLDQAIPEWMEQTFRQSPLREAPFSFAVAAAAAGIELPQSDIGDLFLAATAFIHDLTLVTVDPQLLACSWLRTMAGD